MNKISREQALELLKKYNKDEFHLHHALTVEAVMEYFAKKEGYDSENIPNPFAQDSVQTGPQRQFAH